MQIYALLKAHHYDWLFKVTWQLLTNEVQLKFIQVKILLSEHFSAKPNLQLKVETLLRQIPLTKERT